jgi:peptide-methionine (R)-S-oxide reductase
MNHFNPRALVALALAGTLGAAFWAQNASHLEAAPRAKSATQYKVVKTDAQWKHQLSPQAYDVLRHAGTEAPFTGALANNHAKGIYKCAGCGQELFSSGAKFESGTGWPSFFQPIRQTAIEKRADNSLFGERTEVLCSRCGGHLGHVFDDGPKPTGLRYCMNSAALSFEKKAAR